MMLRVEKKLFVDLVISHPQVIFLAAVPWRLQGVESTKKRAWLFFCSSVKEVRSMNVDVTSIRPNNFLQSYTESMNRFLTFRDDRQTRSFLSPSRILSMSVDPFRSWLSFHMH